MSHLPFFFRTAYFSQSLWWCCRITDCYLPCTPVHCNVWLRCFNYALLFLLCKCFQTMSVPHELRLSKGVLLAVLKSLFCFTAILSASHIILFLMHFLYFLMHFLHALWRYNSMEQTWWTTANTVIQAWFPCRESPTSVKTVLKTRCVVLLQWNYRNAEWQKNDKGDREAHKEKDDKLSD